MLDKMSPKELRRERDELRDELTMIEVVLPDCFSDQLAGRAAEIEGDLAAIDGILHDIDSPLGLRSCDLAAPYGDLGFDY